MNFLSPTFTAQTLVEAKACESGTLLKETPELVASGFVENSPRFVFGVLLSIQMHKPKLEGTPRDHAPAARQEV